MARYVYYVGYVSGPASFGRAEMVWDRPITTIGQIRDIETIIARDHNIRRPVVLSCHLLRTEG